MGLPVWRAPSPAESKRTIKTDSTAASRSPIRRSPRPHRSNARRIPSTSARADPRSRRNIDPSFLDPRRYTGSYSFDSSDRDSDATSRDTLLPPVPELNYVPSQRPSGEERIRFGQFARAHLYTEPESMSTSSFDTQGASTASTRFEGPPSVRHEYLPYTRNFAPARYPPPRPLEPLRESYTRTSSRRGSSPPTRPRPSRSFEVLFFDGDEDNGQRRSYPTLPSIRRLHPERRIPDGPLPSSSLRASWSPISPVDGLGDRERSFSPDDDNWDTMLSTIAPDAHLPSTDSSFTSAAATASFSAANRGSNSASSINSAASSRTHLTIPSQNHSTQNLSGMPCDSSDDEAAGLSDTEDESIEIQGPPRQRVGAPFRILGGTPASGFRRPRDSYGDSVHHYRNAASRYLTDYYSNAFAERAGSRNALDTDPTWFVPGTRSPPMSTHRDDVEDEGSSDLERDELERDIRRMRSQSAAERERDGLSLSRIDDPELEHMRNVLERLARRDDIPDDFWISAGLAPPLGERVDRVRRERL